MATTSISHRWKYDVFVSFRGDDIRKGFMDHMFSDFKRKGIRAFRDDRQLPKGEAISPHLYKAIEESSCLCEDVKEVTKRQGIIHVQMHLINNILKTEDLKISCVGEGSTVIKQRMACKPILLVLDGKDKQLLRSHTLDEIHDMDFLNKDQSLQLFSSYAFEEKCPSTRFQELAEKVWVSELERLREHPNEEIQQVLRLSYNGLNLEQQNILLDIACLFIGENSDFVASILDGCNFFADTNMRVLVDKSLITISSNMSLQMHDLIQAMAREIIHEESIMTGKQRRLWHSSLVYNVLSEKKVEITQVVEVLVLSLEKFSQKVHIDANDFAHMKKLRILKIYQQEDHGWYEKLELTSHNCFRRLKVMKLSMLYLTTHPDFQDYKFSKQPRLEGCVNLVSVHPSIRMLKKLVVLNLRDCKRLQNFPSRVETGCQKVNQLPKADTTAITKLPSFVSSLINLESLSFSGQGRIQPTWWTSITDPFGFIWNQQHPQRSLSLAGLHMLKSLNFSNCNLLQVPESIGGLSCLKYLYLEGNTLLELPESIGGLSHLNYLNLEGNNLTRLPGSLSQLSHLKALVVNGCKKLEVLPELPHTLLYLYANDCTSLCSITGSSKDPIMMNDMSSHLSNCPKLFTNLAIDSGLSISETQCLDSSITSQGSTNQISSFLQYAGIQNNNRCEFFRFLGSFIYNMDIIYDGNSIPKCIEKWKEAKNFVTFCFEKINKYNEVKECGARVVCDEDLEQDKNFNLLQDFPTLSQHGGVKISCAFDVDMEWSW
ncbi:NB-ARC domains-containing protein [Tanacetum coccineum]